MLDSRWDRSLHPAVRRETPRPPALVFMRRGSYTRKMGSARVVGDALHTVMYSNGEEAVIEHPFGDQTAGTTIRFTPGAELWSLLEGMGLGSADRGGGAFPVRVCLRAARTESAHRGLLRALRGGECVEVQEAMVHLLAASVGDAAQGEGSCEQQRPGAAGGTGAGVSCKGGVRGEGHALHDVGTAGGGGARRGICHGFLGRLWGMPVHRYLTLPAGCHAAELLEER